MRACQAVELSPFTEPAILLDISELTEALEERCKIYVSDGPRTSALHCQYLEFGS